MRLKSTIVAAYHNVFNAKLATVSFFCNALAEFAWTVIILDRPGEALDAGVALWQGIASFFSTGFTGRVVQHFSPIGSPLKSYSLGSLIPAAITFGLSLAGHLWGGTPDPLLSCLPATTISFTTSFVTNYLTRRGLLLPGNYRAP
ncbi:MAG TPA: hypothetical protein VGP13_00595 [Candidatus Paceibacterota bacterium]|jgi:hypothetical protein|nr:hypothetical protein [Candidatus Paceibacterota bacterium]